MKVILHTERLTLRELGPEDAEAFIRLRSDPQIMRYTGEQPESDLEVVRQQLAAYPDYEKYGYGRWGMVLAGEVIGFAGLKFLEDRQEVDVGYRLVPEHWGKGLATEATRACIEYGFAELGMERIIAMMMPANVGSIRVAEKCGMAREGLIIDRGMEVLLYSITSAAL